MSRCVSCIHFNNCTNFCNHLRGSPSSWDAEHCQHFYCDDGHSELILQQHVPRE